MGYEPGSHTPPEAAPEAPPEGVAPVAPETPPTAPETQELTPSEQRMLDIMERGFASFANLQARPPEPRAPEEPAAPEYTADDLLRELDETNFTPDGEITLEGIQEFVRRTYEREAASARSRESARQAAESRTQGLQALEVRYPALKNDPAVIDAVADRALELAEGIVAGTGLDPAVVAQTPGLVEQVYLRLYPDANVAPAESADATTPPVPVERPGAAAATPAATKDLGDELVELWQGSHHRVSA